MKSDKTLSMNPDGAAELFLDPQRLLARENAASLSKAWRRFLAHRLMVVSLVALVVIHLLVFLGPLVWLIRPETINPANDLAPLSLAHPLGTDDLGRDVLSRVLYGGQVTLLVGFSAMVTSVILGLFIGAVAAFYGGWLDRVLMRLTDALMAVPNFFLAVVAVTVLGTGPVTLILVIGTTSWMVVARVVYGETLHWKTREFVTAAEATGVMHFRVLWRHVLPQTLPSVIVSASLGVGWAILVESALSYLGLGIQPPTPSWGNMLQNSQQYVWTAPWLAVYPGVAITLVVLAYNFLGDGLRDFLDPRLQT